MSISHYFFIPALSGFIILSLAISGDLMQGSFAAFIVGIGLCAVAGILVWQRKLITVPPLSTLLSGLLLVGVSVVSAWRVGLTQDVAFGSSMEWGTIASLCLFSISFFVGSMVSRKVIPIFLWSVEVAGAVGGVVVLCVATGFAPAITIATSWMQLSFIFCAAALVAAARVDTETTAAGRATHVALALVSLGSFVMLFVSEAGAVALAAALIVSYAASRSARERFPYASVALALTFLALFVFGMRSPVIALSDDSRPSLQATSLITGPEFIDSSIDSLIGTGPRTFSVLWNKYRSSDENASPLWRLTPKYSYSAFSTVTLEDGLLGMFALMLFLIIPILYAFNRSRTEDSVIGPGSALAVVGLFLMLSAFVSPLGIPILIIAALTVGMCAPYDPSTGLRITERQWIVVLAACVLLTGVASVYISYRQLFAARSDAIGLALLDQGDPERALPFLSRATDLWETSEYDQDTASAYLKAGLAEQKSGSPGSAHRYIDAAMAFAGRTVQADSNNFSRALFNASLYFTLMKNGVAGTESKVRDSLDHAAALSPTRPEVPYARALLALAQGNTKEALAQLDKAIALKSDYEDALTLRLKIMSIQ